MRCFPSDSTALKRQVAVAVLHQVASHLFTVARPRCESLGVLSTTELNPECITCFVFVRVGCCLRPSPCVFTAALHCQMFLLFTYWAQIVPWMMAPPIPYTLKILHFSRHTFASFVTLCCFANVSNLPKLLSSDCH